MPNPDDLWGLLPADTPLGAGVKEVIDLLDKAGWHPRKRWGARAICLWPDDHRPQQFIIEFSTPIADQRIEEIELRTGVQLRESMKEGER